MRLTLSNGMAAHFHSHSTNEAERLLSCTNAVSCAVYHAMVSYQSCFAFRFCIGCPDIVFNTVRREEVGDVVIIDCDKNLVENPFNDIGEMPSEIVSHLKKQLTNPSADLRGNRIPKIFLSSLVLVIGGYRDAIKYTESKLKFDNDAFIESQSPSNRAFARKMVELQIFRQFVEERLKLIQDGSEMSDEFEMEVELHAEKMGKKFNQTKEFIRNIKSRANPAVKNAVKSVRAMGKELKLKIKDNNQKVEKFDYLNTISAPKMEKSSAPAFQPFYPSVSNNLIDSPSTSSSQSSTSDMNILQELEALPMFQSKTNGTEKPKPECNLIDLSDSIDSMQFDPLESDERRPTRLRDPFGSSELLRDVVDELNRSTTSTVASNRSTWTKFE